jgi:hypothetical protein
LSKKKQWNKRSLGWKIGKNYDLIRTWKVSKRKENLLRRKEKIGIKPWFEKNKIKWGQEEINNMQKWKERKKRKELWL